MELTAHYCSKECSFPNVYKLTGKGQTIFLSMVTHRWTAYSWTNKETVFSRAHGYSFFILSLRMCLKILCFFPPFVYSKARTLFEKNAAPILHLSGMDVTVVKVRLPLESLRTQITISHVFMCSLLLPSEQNPVFTEDKNINVVSVLLITQSSFVFSWHGQIFIAAQTRGCGLDTLQKVKLSQLSESISQNTKPSTLSSLISW